MRHNLSLCPGSHRTGRKDSVETGSPLTVGTTGRKEGSRQHESHKG